MNLLLIEYVPLNGNDLGLVESEIGHIRLQIQNNYEGFRLKRTNMAAYLINPADRLLRARAPAKRLIPPGIHSNLPCGSDFNDAETTCPEVIHKKRGMPLRENREYSIVS